jgi:hypothetical protein
MSHGLQQIVILDCKGMSKKYSHTYKYLMGICTKADNLMCVCAFTYECRIHQKAVVNSNQLSMHKN